ncbi:acyl-coenzyme A--6-aminopenicillanic-acid-acyltransferase form, partial [Streptomyces sp. NPDC044948]
MHHALPVIEISGTPAERGRQYGEAVRSRIGEAIGYYTEAFGEASGLTWDQVTARAQLWLEPVHDHAPDLIEEMRGIADGAGVGLLDCTAQLARRVGASPQLPVRRALPDSPRNRGP